MAHHTPNKFLPMRAPVSGGVSPSGDVSPDLYCTEVLTAGAVSGDVSPLPSPINERSYPVAADFGSCDEEMSEGEDDSSSGDVSPDSVTRAGSHFKHLYGPHLNNSMHGKPHGPFQIYNKGQTLGLNCFQCLSLDSRGAPLCCCMEPIPLGEPGRDLRRLLRHKIPGPYVLSDGPYVLSDGAGPFRYVGKGPRYEKEPQHPTRPGDKGGEGGATWRAAWRWAPLYFDEKGKACRCVGEWCECASVPAE